jgi:cysteine desulfurase family protein
MTHTKVQSDVADIVYLDNGATSFPKPPGVSEAMSRWMTEIGGSPGRSGHRLSTLAAKAVFETRESLARLLGVASSRRIVFTKNATEALNQAIHGCLLPGDRVVTTSMEHNSVMRPLHHLSNRGAIEIETIRCTPRGELPLAEFRAAVARGARMAVITHASNVCGTIMPIPEIASICRAQGTILLVDAAQTAGAVPIDAEGWGIDLLAFTGHKSLFGPTGTGGLYVAEEIQLTPLTQGGTGSFSENEEQPAFLPDNLESGTLNAVGLAGLAAGVDFILEQGLDRIRQAEVETTAALLDGLSKIPGVTVQGPGDPAWMSAVVSITFDGLSPSEAGFLLDEGFGVLTRVGLHCAPSAHRTIGTFPAGTVRLAPGYFTTAAQIDRTLRAIDSLARRSLA